MSDGYPFIFQMVDKSDSDEYLSKHPTPILSV